MITAKKIDEVTSDIFDHYDVTFTETIDSIKSGTSFPFVRINFKSQTIEAYDEKNRVINCILPTIIDRYIYLKNR